MDWPVPVGGDLPVGLELDGAGGLLGLEVELDQKVVVDVAGEETALVDADRGGDILLLRVFGLVDVGTLVLRAHVVLVEFQLEGAHCHLR